MRSSDESNGLQRSAQDGRRVRRRARLLVLVFLIVLPILGASCKQGIPKDVAARLKPVSIEWWGVNETEEEVAPLLAEYRKLRPHVGITYRRFRYGEFEQRLLDALAEADFKGPDIISLPSANIRRYRTKLLPAPKVITMPFKELRGTVKKEVFAELRSTRMPTPGELQNLLIDAVIPDAVLPTEPTAAAPSVPAVFGLPLAADTLVLYANRDLLNAAGIPEPARTWTEFQAQVSKLTKVATDGKIVQAGAAIGTGRNVQRAFDILSLLMMQNGAVMADTDGTPSFDRIPQSLGSRSTAPAEDALLYYTDFANAQRVAYTWNDEQPDSVEAFLEGRVAYLFGYSYHLPIIKARAPRVNLIVTGVPHMAAAVDPETSIVVGSDIIEGSNPVAVNIANVWLLTASERTKYPNEVWDFILTVTTKPPVVEKFLAVAGRPTALRSLVGKQIQDPQLRVFAAQLLTARTWYRGRNLTAAEDAFRELIDDVRRGGDVRVALQLAAQKVAQTL